MTGAERFKPLSTFAQCDTKMIDCEPEQGNDASSGDKSCEPQVAGILSTPIIAALINHPFHLSCPPASVIKFSVNLLAQEINRLDRKGNNCCHSETVPTQEREAPTAEDVPTTKKASEKTPREILDRVSSMQRQLDAKIAVNTGHDYELRQIRERATPLNLDDNDNICCSCSQQVRELASSLSKLRNDNLDLRSASIIGIKGARNELDRNYTKITNYVQEEVESTASHQILQMKFELEACRYENSRLKAELDRTTQILQRSTCTGSSKARKSKQKYVPAKPPSAPTLEHLIIARRPFLDSIVSNNTQSS